MLLLIKLLANMKNYSWLNKAYQIIPIIVFLIIPLVSFAAAITEPTCGSGTHLQAGICVPDSSGDGILGATDVVDLAKKVFNILLYLAGIIAVLFIIIGGYQYLTSGGNDEDAEKGKKTVTNALIGLIVVILAFTIVNVLTGTIGGSSGG